MSAGVPNHLSHDLPYRWAAPQLNCGDFVGREELSHCRVDIAGRIEPAPRIHSEAGTSIDGTEGVRDSKDISGPTLEFRPDAWSAFTSGVDGFRN